MNSPLLPNYNRADIAFDRGEGPYLFDAKGERYLDFGSGVAVSALGHAHPHLVAALQEQAAKAFEKDGPKPVETVDPAELYEQIGRLKMELEWVKKKVAQFHG